MSNANVVKIQRGFNVYRRLKRVLKKKKHIYIITKVFYIYNFSWSENLPLIPGSLRSYEKKNRRALVARVYIATRKSRETSLPPPHARRRNSRDECTEVDCSALLLPPAWLCTFFLVLLQRFVLMPRNLWSKTRICDMIQGIETSPSFWINY